MNPLARADVRASAALAALGLLADERRRGVVEALAGDGRR